MDILSLLVKTELAPSRSDARRAVEQGGVSVADEKVTDIKTAYNADSFGADGLVVKRGKKKFVKVARKIIMNYIVRNAQMSDYDSVVRILNQGQALHINWRPDIYKPNDALLPKAVFEEIVKGDTFYIAENEGNVIGILELIFRHIESPAQVTRDIVFIDTMAVDEPYRGMGVGHLFFEKVKEIKAEKNLDGIELQVNAKNKAAYEMYCNYGFTEKSINMELL